MALYVLLATIAALVPDREAAPESSAPFAAMFEELSGVNPKPIEAIADIAMIFPLVRLAQLTSLVTLAPGIVLARWRFLGLLAACLAVALGGWRVTHGLSS